ncbi:MAG: hypothetical protein WDZ29_04975 [Balneolaceae bacterium]
MFDRKDILHDLEISCTILRTSINALAARWKVSHTHVRQVAMGRSKSERIRKQIEQTITEAKGRVPFETVNPQNKRDDE